MMPALVQHLRNENVPIYLPTEVLQLLPVDRISSTTQKDIGKVIHHRGQLVNYRVSHRVLTEQ
jgi:hypothetical protein